MGVGLDVTNSGGGRMVVVLSRGISPLTVVVHMHTVADALHALQCSWSVPRL